MAAPKSLLKGFERTVATIKPDPSKRLTVSDPDTRGLYLRVTPAGHKSYVVVARDPAGKQVWATIGDCDDHTLAEARDLAGEGVRRIRKGLVAFPKAELEKAPDTFKVVAEKYLSWEVRKEHVKVRRTADDYPLRSADEIERTLKTYVYPEWGERAFLSIRRSDVNSLLKKIAAGQAGASGKMGGPVMADRTLAVLSKLFNCEEKAQDDYVSPIVRGMRHTKAKDRARARTLSDDEIRALWKAAGDRGAFGAFLKLLLLTGQRRSKVAGMQWADLEDGVWTIPTEEREKGNPGALKLPALALEVIEGIPRVEDNPFVFAGRGKVAMAIGDKLKKELDAELGFTKDWTLHDLRRTARTLLANTKIPSDHAERLLGHAITGVRGTYDRHGYFEQNAKALEALAGLVALILDPPAGNVVPLREGAA